MGPGGRCRGQVVPLGPPPSSPGRGAGPESPVVRTLRVVGALTAPRSAAPRGPRLPGGGPHFSREMGRKRAGGLAPWTPFFMARSLPLARFGVVGRSGAVVGLLRSPSACPDLGAFFRGIFLGHIGGHVEQNSVCRDTNAVDEKNNLTSFSGCILSHSYNIFHSFFGFLFRLGGALLSPGREGGARIPGSTYPSGGRGFSGASGRSAP